MPVSEPLARPLRVFVAGISHETNSFSPLPTSMRSFETDCAYVPPALAMRDIALAFPGYGDAIRTVTGKGDHPVEGPCFFAQPSAPCSASVFARLRDAILDALRDAGPIDIVLLALHGAMVAEGVGDCEGDLLMAVRALVGPEMPVGVILDLHGNVGARMIDSGAMLVGVKEYPHSDYALRVNELYAMLVDMARMDAHYMMSLRSVPVLSLQGTTEEPMRSFVAHLTTMEEKVGIRSVTMMHGFPWADCPEGGASVLILSQNVETGAVDRLADDLAARFTDVVQQAPVARLSAADAVTAALSVRPGSGPVVIADSADNPGGGAACDSNFLLRELNDRGCRDVAIGMIWDPQAARIAADAGEGARLPLRVGGKVGLMSGAPVDLDVEVLAIRDDVKQRFFSDTPNSSLGLSVALRAGGIDLIVNSIRQQVFGPECFTALGIDLAKKSIIAVKSSQHFRKLFDPIAGTTIYCDALGSMTTDLSLMPFHHMEVERVDGVFRVARPVVRLHRRIGRGSTVQP